MNERFNGIRSKVDMVGRVIQSVGHEVKSDILAPITFALSFQNQRSRVLLLASKCLILSEIGLLGGATNVLATYALWGIIENHPKGTDKLLFRILKDSTT